MEDMTNALEDLLVCASLGRGDRDCVERALDEGYAALDAGGKGRIRQLLNQRSARSGSALQRYRERRLSTGLASMARQAARGAARSAGQPLH